MTIYIVKLGDIIIKAFKYRGSAEVFLTQENEKAVEVFNRFGINRLHNVLYTLEAVEVDDKL